MMSKVSIMSLLNSPVRQLDVVLYSNKLSNGTYPIRLRLYYGEERYISLGLSCKKTQWNQDKGRFNHKMPDYEALNKFLDEKEELALTLIQSYRGKRFDFETFKEKFKRGSSSITLLEFLQFIKPKLSYSNWQKYDQMGRVVLEFYGKKKLYLEDIDPKFLRQFEEYLTKRRKNKDGSSLSYHAVRFYFATLGACISKAIEWEYLKPEFYPFRNQANPKGFSYSKYKTTKPKPRALTVDSVDKLKAFYQDCPVEFKNTLNYFFFSYYAHGMSFCDVALLKKSQIINGRIYYSRQKTKHEVPSIRINPQMRLILDQYKTKSDYVFPILSNTKAEKEIYWEIVNSRRVYGEQLEKVGKLIGTEIKLTSYVSRYTFANQVIRNGADVRKLKDMLGHASIEYTMRYLESVEDEERDALQNIL